MRTYQQLSPSRRDFLGRLGAGALALGCLGAATATAQAQRPNILFLFTDDNRFDTIGALGNPHIETPNLDRLARSGTSFTNAYIMGGLNAAVCMPSRNMLLTGRTLFSVGEGAQRIDPSVKTLPETLRAAGYTTFHTGKWHQDRQSFARGFSTATSIFFGGMSSHYDIPIHDFNPAGNYPNDAGYRVTDTHSTDLYADAAAGFLDSYKGNDPFFMYVAFQAPHDPRHMPQKYRDMYDPATIPVPGNFLSAHPFDFGEANHRDEKLERWPRTPDRVRQHIADYYAMITHVDDAIGRILAALERSGKADNTVIVYAADNGLAVGQHGLMGKQSIYDHSVHVPLVFTGPGIPAGERRDAFCYLSDLFPTLCGLAGAAVPGTVEGESLLPAIADETLEIRQSLFFAFKHFQRAVRTKRWKLIRFNVFGEQHIRLFDLENDPAEARNLADDPANHYLVHGLTGLMKDWMAKLGDPADLDAPDWGVEPIAPWKPSAWQDPNPDVFYESNWTKPGG